MEAIAAGKTVIATDVGGMNEIFGPLKDRLIPARPAGAGAGHGRSPAPRPRRTAAERAELARNAATHFSVEVMVDRGLDAYRAGLARKGRAPEAAPAGASGGASGNAS